MDACRLLSRQLDGLGRRRRPTWTTVQRRAVRALRERYPRWGKDKLRILLRRSGMVLSTSIVGRILGRHHERGGSGGTIARVAPDADDRDKR